jgi:hypothetical protein
MPLTPVEMQQIELKRSANGYDCAEADRLIDDFATAYEALWLERIDLQERVESLERRLARSRRRRILAVALLLVAAVAGGFVLWLRSSDRSTEVAPEETDRPSAGQTREAAAPSTERQGAPVFDRAAPAGTHAVGQRSARLVLKATRGDSWLVVRARSETGELLYQGTLTTGRTLQFVRKRLWLRVGAPANLDVRLNGKLASGFPRSTADVVVTPRGMDTVFLG